MISLDATMGALGGGVISCAGWVSTYWLTRKSSAKAANAAQQEADTNSWEAYNQAVYRWAMSLADRVEGLEGKMDALTERADKAERKASVAVGYLRRLTAWIKINVADSKSMPKPPPELEDDL